jgi:hypothetical protein
MAFPAIRRSPCKAASHRVAPHHLDREASCAAAKNVHGNTILDATLGLFGVPSGTVSTNTYYNVGQINPSGTC